MIKWRVRAGIIGGEIVKVGAIGMYTIVEGVVVDVKRLSRGD